MKELGLLTNLSLSTSSDIILFHEVSGIIIFIESGSGIEEFHSKVLGQCAGMCTSVSVATSSVEESI